MDRCQKGFVFWVISQRDAESLQSDQQDRKAKIQKCGVVKLLASRNDIFIDQHGIQTIADFPQNILGRVLIWRSVLSSRDQQADVAHQNRAGR
jgi:hypothetical protein